MTYIQKGQFEFRPCKLSDVDHLVNNLRLSDVRECALVGASPEMALAVPFMEDGAKGFTITHKGTPIAMCGVTPLDDVMHVGRIWFLGTNLVDKYMLTITKHSKLILSFLKIDYDFVENFVPQDQTSTIKWLESMGFHQEEDPYYFDSVPFIKLFYCNLDNFEQRISKSRPTMH